MGTGTGHTAGVKIQMSSRKGVRVVSLPCIYLQCGKIIYVISIISHVYKCGKS